MGKFSTFFLSLTFGGAVAALGLVDLKHYHDQKQSDPSSVEAARIRNLIQESKGSSSEARAQLAPQPQQAVITSGNTEEQKKSDGDVVNVFKKLAP
jgi:hypothetical protein